MSGPDAFYEPLGGDRFRSTPATSGPWDERAQHGGPPGALLARALEGLGEGVVGRFTMDLLGPVPVADVEVGAEVLRPGRSVSLRQATIGDSSGRVAARAQSWVFPSSPGAGSVGDPLPHRPDDGHEVEPPRSWGAATSTRSSGAGSRAPSTVPAPAPCGCDRDSPSSRAS